MMKYVVDVILVDKLLDREYRNGCLYHKIDDEYEDYRPKNKSEYFW